MVDDVIDVRYINFESSALFNISLVGSCE